MIEAARAWVRRHWPRLRLRTIVFLVLFTVAALPGVGAVFLRVYENALVRQTGAELATEGATLAAVATADWPAAPPGRSIAPGPAPQGEIDLSTAAILPERPFPRPAGPPAPDAAAAAARIAPVLRDTRAATLVSGPCSTAMGEVRAVAGRSCPRWPARSAASR